MQPPDEVYQRCADQLGVISRRQLVAMVGRFDADHLLATSRFERLMRGVYRVRGGANHTHQRAIAATLRVGAAATLTGPAALGLLELEGVELGASFEVLSPGRRRLTEGSFSIRRDPDPERSVWLLGEARIADPADALLHAAAYAPDVRPRALRLAHDRLRWTGHLSKGQLTTGAERLRLKESRLLDELLRMDATAATGDGERRLERVLARFDPPPEPQAWVSPRHCLDFYFREVRLAIEYQGRPDHGTESGRRRDRAREEELTQSGIRSLYVTAEDLRDERGLLARIAGALTARADELGLCAPRLVVD
ncbi:MAG: hypothetical protein R6V28_14135 [Nitriliruptoraceae bacterium]